MAKVKAEDIAFVLHEDWRKTRLNEQGQYEPRWKVVKDEAFVEKYKGKDLPSHLRMSEEGKLEIDIANCGYTMLSADRQAENLAAAKVVVELLDRMDKGEVITSLTAGRVIHDAWLERNSWAKGGELDVPFEQLPPHEQDKDLNQMKIGVKLSQAQEIDSGGTIENVINRFRSLGKGYCANFSGHLLFSEFDTLETAYMKVCGKTKEEHDRKIEEEYKKYEQERTQKIAEAKAKISEYVEGGKRLIYPEKMSQWIECVVSESKGLYCGESLVPVVEVMTALEDGAINDAQVILNEFGGPMIYHGNVLFMITEFSKQGPEFFKKVAPPELIEKNQEWLNQLEQENAIYKSIHSSKNKTLVDDE